MKHLSWLPVAAFLMLGHAAPAQNKKDMKKAEPKVVVAVPLAGNPGSKTKVTIRGLQIDTAVEVRALTPGVTARLLKAAKSPVPNNQESRLGDSQLEAEITLPANLPAGEVLLQVITPTAEAAPHRWLVNGVPPLPEKEPNNGFRQPQTIAVPQVIDGGIQQSQDVDVFKFDGQQGQRLTLEVLAARLGSPVDATLTLYDAAGQVIASSDDTAESADPRLEVVLPREGTYFLSLADAHDQGGPQYVYRLLVDVKK